MASYGNIVLIALFFLIATTPRAHGITLGDVVRVNVLGLLSCTVPGTQPASTNLPLGGVTVVVRCNGGTITLGQAVTNVDGFFDATFSLLDGLIFDRSTCEATINLSSVASCSLFPPTGTLRTSLVLVGFVEGVARFVTGGIWIG